MRWSHSRPREPEGAARGTRTGEDVIIRVADNGPGIAPHILESLFTPFNTSKEGGLVWAW